MPKLKVRLGGQWVEIAGGGGVSMADVLDEIEKSRLELEQKLNNADEYISGAFSDGIITVIEAKKIQSFLNTLQTAKDAYDSKYDELANHPDLPSTAKTNLMTAKSAADSTYLVLLDAIDSAIEDGKAGDEESAEVNSAFALYRSALAVLELMMTRAQDAIAGNYASQAVDEAKEYVDGLVSDLEEQLNETAEYIDGAFRDGIIYDAEYRKIASYLNTLNASKIEFDERYNQIYNSPELSEDIKNDLTITKTNYDSAYNTLIELINDVIEDQKATDEESAAVNAAFATYTAQLSALTAILEEAVFDIQKQQTGQVNTQQLLNNSLFKGFNPFETPDKRLAFWSHVSDEWNYDTIERFETFPTMRLDATEEQSNSMFSDYLDTTEDIWYTFSLYAKTSDTAPFDNGSTFKIGLYYYGEDQETEVTPHQELTVNFTEADKWKRYIVTGKVPAGASFVRAGIVAEGEQTVWICKPMFQQSKIATEYQDTQYNNPLFMPDAVEINGEYIRAGTLSFDKAFGGTIRLGGPAYGNARLELHNEQGDLTVVISADQRGFDTITCGKIESDFIVTRDPNHRTTIYVDPVEGDDTNPGTSTEQLKTITQALTMLPKYLDKDVTIRVKDNSGHFYEDISIDGFNGPGALTLNFVSFNNILEGQISIQSCSTLIRIQNLKMVYPNENVTDNHLIQARASVFQVTNSELYGRDQARYGIRAQIGCQFRVENVGLYDVERGVNAAYSNIVHMYNTYGDPTNYYIYTIGSLVLCAGTRPQGNKFESQGGRVLWASDTEPSGTLGTKDPNWGSSTTIIVKQTFTSTSSKAWRTWTNNWQSDNYPRQGEWDSYGLHRGFWFFGNAIRNAVMGKTIKSITCKLKRRNQGGNYSSVTAYIRTHNYASQPAASPMPTVSSASVQANFSPGQTKTVDITALKDNFSGGAYGIAIYTSNTSNNYYMIFEPEAEVTIRYETTT